MAQDLNQDLNRSNNQDLNTPSSVNTSSLSLAPSSGSNFDFSGIFLGFGLILCSILLIFALILYLRRYFYNKKRINDWKNTVFVEVAVPKETAEQAQKDRANSSQNDQSSLEAGERLFSVMSDYAKGSFKNWLFGGPRFSLEIVSIEQEIRFWLVCEEEMASVLERQISAIYPKANTKRIDDPIIFKKESLAYIQEFELGSRFELPFKTYKMMEGDLLNSITSAMGGLSKEESAAIQLVLTPLTEEWQEEPRNLATKITQGQNAYELLFPKSDFFGVIGSFFGFFTAGIADQFKTKKEDEPFKQEKKDRRNMDISGRYEQIQLTEQQREITKKLEEKASKPGFYFTLRIVGSSMNETRAKQIVDGIIPSFQGFENRPYNFITKRNTNPKESILNFLLRANNFQPAFNFGDRKDLINTEEATSMWHVPNYLVNTPNIKWLSARKPAIPLEIPLPGEDTIYIGKASARGQVRDIYMKKEDRFRHVYTLGGSGSGKSVLMSSMILQDISAGNGLCVIDPHGELVDDILLRLPEERADDVIIFSPAFVDKPVGLNMLEYDPLKPTQKTLVISTLFSIWDKLYDLKKTGGPMFESYMKNSMRLVMSHPESGSTLMEINKVLTDEDFRSFKLAMCEEQEVVDFWEKEATKAGGEASLENMVPYITSKLAPFVSNDFIRPMIGQQKSAINFREAMDNKKIVLVKLEKGLIGEDSAYLIGMVILGNLLLGGMGRNDGLKYNLDGTTTEILASERTPFFVYIDEMQNFLFDAIPKALEEIRKYKVGFNLAHQFVKQVIVQGDERIKDSIMANCATKFIYRCGAADAELLEKEFAPYVSAQDLMTPERFTFNAIILVDGQKTTPFNIAAPSPDKNIDPEKRKRLIEMSKNKYGKDKAAVEDEIKKRSKLLF